MAIRSILTSDTLGSGFRAKYNETVQEIFTSCIDLGNGVLRFIKFSGQKIEVSLANSFYTKSQVVEKINEPIRMGEVELNEGENMILFSSQFAIGTPWIFTGKPFCFDEFGEVGFVIVSKDHTGFVINTVSACNINYHVTKLI